MTEAELIIIGQKLDGFTSKLERLATYLEQCNRDYEVEEKRRLEAEIDSISPEAKSRVAELLSRYTNTTREQVIESLLAEQAKLNVEKK